MRTRPPKEGRKLAPERIPPHRHHRGQPAEAVIGLKTRGHRRTRRAPEPAPARPGIVDPLTGLPGRVALKEHLDLNVSLYDADGLRTALVQFALPDFRLVEQEHGPRASDEVLRWVAARLTERVGRTGQAFRCGRSTFAAVLEPTAIDDALAWAEVGVAVIGEPAAVPGGAIDFGLSAAVVMTEPGMTTDEVLHGADLTLGAMYEAGPGCVGWYGPEVDEWFRGRGREIENLVRRYEDLRLENRRLLELALVDRQTGLPNAASFEADHTQLHARRKRADERYSVLMVFIDGFAAHHDLVGPEQSLEVVRAVGASVSETVRESDRTYRMADGEFAVLLPGTDLREAVAAAERVRARVERLGLQDAGQKVTTVTVGAIGAGFRHASQKDVLNELSDLLVDARRSGTNRTVWPH